MVLMSVNSECTLLYCTVLNCIVLNSVYDADHSCIYVHVCSSV